MVKTSPTPRRGIPALIAQLRRECKRLKLDAKELTQISDIHYKVAWKLLSKNPQKNLNKKTEESVRTLLRVFPDYEEGMRPRKSVPGGVQQELPLDPAPDAPETRTVIGLALDSIMEEVTELLPLAKDKAEYLRTQIAGHIEAALEAQCEASSELVSKLEEELADKDTQLVAHQRAGNAQYQLGKDVAHMADPERQALQGLLNAKEVENIHLRDTIKSLSQTL